MIEQMLDRQPALQDERRITPFTELQLAIKGNVEIIPAEEERVVIEGDEDVVSRVETKVIGRMLHVSTPSKSRLFFTKPLSVKVYVRELQKLENMCRGNVRSSGPLVCANDLNLRIFAHGDTELDIRTPNLQGWFASHGKIHLSGECWEANIKNASHGDLLAREIIAANLFLLNMAHGSVELYSQQSLTIRNMGHGDIRYYGEGIVKDILQFGHGEILKA